LSPPGGNSKSAGMMKGFISSVRSISAVVSTVSVITFMPTQQPE